MTLQTAQQATRLAENMTNKAVAETVDEMVDALAGRPDVAIIGGGAAGLSAALVLSRARRNVVVVDAGAPRNAPANGVHGFLTRDGTHPSELLLLGRQEVGGYGGKILRGEATAARRIPDGFEV